MQLPSFHATGTRRRVIAIAALCAALPLHAGEQAAPASIDDYSVPDDRQRVSVYTVINLGPQSSAAKLNEHGQAAFTSTNRFGTVSRFFDGERVLPIGSLGGDFSWVSGLNNHGMVVGQSSTGGQPDRSLGFAWTPAGGMRALPGASPSSANDVNDRNEIVGAAPAPGVAARAVRWNPDGSVTALGPLPLLSSTAAAINNRGYATGSVYFPNGGPRAMLWDPAGGETDLAPPSRSTSQGLHINERNEVAGQISLIRFSRALGFFWSRDSGTVQFGELPPYVADLNNRGEVVGTTAVFASAFQWSLGRGWVPLPLPSGGFGSADDINDHGEAVGAFQPYEAELGDWRAVRWPSFMAQPIELGMRLYRAPAGLVLRNALAINNNGTILAESNAGLVMLRPGRRGTDAPVLGPIAGLPDWPATIALGQELTLNINFVDKDAAQTHTASVVWSDACASAAPTVTEAGGVGQVRLQHRFCEAGYGGVKVVVTDSAGRATELQRDVIVEAPALAAISGEGVLAGAPTVLGRGYRHAPLRFALWAPLGDAPAGGIVGAAGPAAAPVVLFSGPFQFRSEQVTRAMATAGRARVEGIGRLNGRDGYRFTLEAVDGGAGAGGDTGDNARGAGGDRLRVRVTHTDATTAAEVVDYDTGALTSVATTERGVVTQGGLMLRPR